MPDLERKIYQLIISRLDGEHVSSGPYQERIFELVRKGIGGFIIFGGRKKEMRTFIARLQSLAETPLFICSDIERGAGQQIEGAVQFPPQMAVAAAINRESEEAVQLLCSAVKAIAHEAIDVGINMPLIPVMDVNQNPDNPIICTRAFADNPRDVAWFGTKYIQVLEESGLISCAKHFPGHGDTDMDSHLSLPVILKSVHELMRVDIFPFREAVKAGVSSIMLGHLSIPEIDTMPAPLSEKIITGLLRRELGFEGLVLTDALNMHALNTFNNVPEKCIHAGADILLHPADADHVVKELKKAVLSGKIAEKKIDTAGERILRYKSNIEHIQITEKNNRTHKELSRMISERSISLVNSPGERISHNDLKCGTLVYAGDEKTIDTGPLRAFFASTMSIAELSPEKIPEGEAVVFALFTSIAAWKGSSGLKQEDITAIKEAIKKPGKSLVLAFGSPYVLRHFREADLLIAAYDASRQAQESVIQCVKGERDFKGLLPVTISFS